MPRPVSWLPNLHAIRKSVGNSVRSHYDRNDIELLFKLQPSAANKLIGLMPRSGLGSSHLVTRDALAKFLERVAEADDVPALLDRMRTENKLVSRRKPRSMTRQDMEPIGMAALPSWIKLTRGRLEMEYETAEQFVEGMVMLANVLTNNFEEFCAAYEPPQELKFDIAAAAEMQDLYRDLEVRERAYLRA